jgi:phage/plasmid-like protein (TIGR03299 family)
MIDNDNIDGIASSGAIMPERQQDISTADLVVLQTDRYLSRKLPWAGIGQPVSAKNVTMALQQAHLDWTVSKVPIYYKKPQYPESAFAVETPVKRRMGVMRNDNGEVLEVVGDKYELVQNAKGFAILDDVLAHSGMAIETAGQLNGGRVVWIEAKTDAINVLKEKIDPYILFSNSHDGTKKLTVCLTMTRVVCINTLNMALEGAKRKWEVKHTKTADDRIEEALETLGMIDHYLEMYPQIAEDFATVNLSTVEEVQFIQNLFPIAKTASRKMQISVEKKREALADIYQNTPDLAPHRGTAWGMMQAVADLTSHAEIKKWKQPDKMIRAKESKFINLIDGHQLMSQAQGLAAAIAA